jgi:hypothetical protein
VEGGGVVLVSAMMSATPPSPRCSRNSKFNIFQIKYIGEKNQKQQAPYFFDPLQPS